MGGITTLFLNTRFLMEYSSNNFIACIFCIIILQTDYKNTMNFGEAGILSEFYLLYLNILSICEKMFYLCPDNELLKYIKSLIKNKE